MLATAAVIALALAAVIALGLAAPAHADVDTDFADQLHTYGIYAPRDYNAWLGRIVYKRLGNGEDADAFKSAHFISNNLPHGHYHGAVVEVPRCRHQYILPRPDARPSTGRRAAQLKRFI